MEEQETTEKFYIAAEYARNMKNLDQTTMLKLYALYKQATVGKCNTAKPGFWDIVGKSKWESWQKLGDMSVENAKQEYINLVLDLDETLDESTCDSKPKGAKKVTGMGLAVSTMCHNEEEIIRDENKTAFDWCKEGNADKVSKLASMSGFDVNSQDENGMSLLHWSCDRGHNHLVKLLIKLKANVNLQDLDLQTPLHYATVCEHDDIVQMLLDAGADTTLKDDAGLTASESTNSNNIKELIRSKEIQC